MQISSHLNCPSWLQFHSSLIFSSNLSFVYLSVFLLFIVRKIGANAKDNMTKLSRSSESIMIALAILRMTTYPIKTQYVFALDLFQTLFYCMAKFASQSYLTWGWLAGTDKRYDILIYALHSLFAFFVLLLSTLFLYSFFDFICITYLFTTLFLYSFSPPYILVFLFSIFSLHL